MIFPTIWNDFLLHPSQGITEILEGKKFYFLTLYRLPCTEHLFLHRPRRNFPILGSLHDIYILYSQDILNSLRIYFLRSWEYRKKPLSNLQVRRRCIFRTHMSHDQSKLLRLTDTILLMLYIDINFLPSHHYSRNDFYLYHVWKVKLLKKKFSRKI